MKQPAGSFDPRIADRGLGELSGAIRWVALGEIDSTNDEARRRARQGAPSWTVVVADRQRSGRGRLGREWHSGAGLGLYLSVLIRPDGAVPEPARWTIAASVAACCACHQLGAGEVGIKWPNDLVLGGRKLAGTLTELRSSGPRVEEAVIGTGFNVGHRSEDLPPDLRRQATSLRAAGVKPRGTREPLAAAYLVELHRQLHRLECGDWQLIRESWHRLAPAAHGSRVRFRHDERELTGITCGLGETGALRIRRDDGHVLEVRDGDRVIPEEQGTCC